MICVRCSKTEIPSPTFSLLHKNFNFHRKIKSITTSHFYAIPFEAAAVVWDNTDRRPHGEILESKQITCDNKWNDKAQKKPSDLIASSIIRGSNHWWRSFKSLQTSPGEWTWVQSVWMCVGACNVPVMNESPEMKPTEPLNTCKFLHHRAFLTTSSQELEKISEGLRIEIKDEGG